MLRVVIALALSGALAAPAFAQRILKCVQADGRIEYRNSPCPEGTRRYAVEMSNLSIIESERLPSSVRGTDATRADDASRAPRAPNAPATPTAPPAPAAERSSSSIGTAETALDRMRY